MKIRHPFVIRLAAFVLAWLIRVWIGTLWPRYRPLGQNVDPLRRDLADRFIYAFWHENLLLPACFYANPRIQVLVSQHADGELIARACNHLGIGTIRGSTKHGGAEALLRLVRASRACHLAVVPDGPRGPRRHIQVGLIYLASRTGLAIVPIGIGFHRPWRAKSWDRFALPRPWSRAKIVTTEPVRIPPDLAKHELEAWRQYVEGLMHEVTRLAEKWAETGKWPAAASQPANQPISPEDQEQAA